MTSNTYTISDYSVTTSLSEHCVYIRVVNNISFQCFEDNVDISECKLPFNNKQIYDILSSCFNNNNKNYNVSFLMKKDILNLEFNILFDTKFDVNFSFILREMVMKADSKMTMNFHRLEAEYNKKIESLENKVKKLEAIIESIGNIHPFIDSGSYPLNSVELRITEDTSTMHLKNKINCFYQLNKLNLEIHDSCINFKNKTLKILSIQNCPQKLQGSTYVNVSSLTSLNGLNNLPSLETIEIRTNSLTNPDNIIPHLHKNIKKISFFNGYGLSTKEKLIPYCNKNNIELLYF